MAWWNFKKQEQKAVSLSDDLIRDYFGLNTTSSGVAVNEQTALRHAAVFACIRVLAESISQLPMKLYKEVDGERVEEKGTRLAHLLTKSPNDFQTTLEFIELIITHLALRGNFYAYINQSPNGKIVELLPLQPDQVQPKINDDGSLIYQVTFNDKNVQYLSQKQILHIKGLSTNGYVGLNPIEHARTTLGVAIAAQQHGESFFANNASVAGFLSTEHQLTDDQFEAVKSTLKQYAGSKNAFKTMILENGMSFQPIAMNNRDSQFLETRAYQTREICGLFRVPPHMVGDLERATFSNIEHQSLSFLRDTLSPYLVRIESRINAILPAGYSIQFDDSVLTRGDAKTRAELASKYISLGVWSPDEVRAMEGMNPREDGLGDRYIIGSNNLNFGLETDEENTETDTETV